MHRPIKTPNKIRELSRVRFFFNLEFRLCNVTGCYTHFETMKLSRCTNFTDAVPIGEL